jgi:hypothetical protein
MCADQWAAIAKSKLCVPYANLVWGYSSALLNHTDGVEPCWEWCTCWSPFYAPCGTHKCFRQASWASTVVLITDWLTIVEISL